MNDNGKNDNDENYSKKNLGPSFNQVKMNQNKSYRENNKTNLIKENTYNNLYKLSSNDSFENIDENPNQVVSKILDNINKNSLSTFYDSDSEFKNKIDSLNLKFYLETEKYLCNQNKKIQTQTSLFIILFKQIIIYIKEIERLNLIIINKKYKPENIIKRTDDIAQKQKEFQTKEDIINALKKSQSNMESKLLQALINENNLNKKIEQLQKEIEFYRNKINNINNLNNDLHMIKIDKTMSNSFNNDKKEELYDRYNENNDNSNNNIVSNDIKTNKKKNSHNSVCITNSSNSRIKNIIKINKSINMKSKSPTNFNNKKTSIKYQNFKNVNTNVKRNHSEKDDKLKNNNKTNNQNINKNNYKNQNFEEMKYKGYLITDLRKNESINFNNKKIRLDKIDKNANALEMLETEPEIIKGNNFKKIIITNKNKLIKEDNITFRNTKKPNNNLKIDLLLSNSNLSNNINSSKKQKNEFNMNKCIYNCYNTIANYTSKYKSDNAFNYFKLANNKKKIKFENHNILNNIHQSNNNINRVINKNMLNEQKSKSLLKREKNNKTRIKNIINISSSTGYKKDINGHQSKKS